MNPERLLRHFDQIAEAPDAVPRLRRFILDLAVRGKLVEQNPEDESASELLKRIEKENKKSEAITSFSADIDPPFEIPIQSLFMMDYGFSLHLSYPKGGTCRMQLIVIPISHSNVLL